MLARIKPNRRIGVSLNYNEKKVMNGKAERIGSRNFLQEHTALTKDDILARFRQRSSFNQRLHDHGAHITLNFGTQEKLADQTLATIARRYMEGMGFADEPFVVYKHKDAGHTHLHVVTTTVRADGSWIRFEPPDYHRSQHLCRQLENEFSLEKNRKHSLGDKARFDVDHAQTVTYGEPGLTRHISDVLNTVFNHYNFTTLDEFNAILRQYNVQANPGKEDSRLRKQGGLQYHAVDQNGDSIGVPMKASFFTVKPTLKRLEQKFGQDRSLRESSRERLHTAIEWALAGRAPTWSDLQKDLEKDGIAIVTGKNRDGKESVFFIDHVKKVAFSGQSIGAGYRLESLRNRCAKEEQLIQQQEQRLNLKL